LAANKIGARGSSRTCTGDALDIVSLLVGLRELNFDFGLWTLDFGLWTKDLEPPAGAAPAGLHYKSNPQAAARRRKWSQSPYTFDPLLNL